MKKLKKTLAKVLDAALRDDRLAIEYIDNDMTHTMWGIYAYNPQRDQEGWHLLFMWRAVTINTPQKPSQQIEPKEAIRIITKNWNWRTDEHKWGPGQTVPEDE